MRNILATFLGAVFLSNAASGENLLTRLPNLSLDHLGRLTVETVDAYETAFLAALSANRSVLADMQTALAKHREAVLAEAVRVEARIGSNTFSTFYRAIAALPETKPFSFGAFAQGTFPGCAKVTTIEECRQLLKADAFVARFKQMRAEIAAFKEALGKATGDSALTVGQQWAEWSHNTKNALLADAGSMVFSGYSGLEALNGAQYAFKYLTIAVSYRPLVRLDDDYPQLEHFYISLQPSLPEGLPAYLNKTVSMTLTPNPSGEIPAWSMDSYSARSAMLNVLSDAAAIEFILVGTTGTVPQAPLRFQQPYWLGGKSFRINGRNARLQYATSTSTDFEPNGDIDGRISVTRTTASYPLATECLAVLATSAAATAPAKP